MRLLRSMVAVVIVAVVLSMNARASHAKAAKYDLVLAADVFVYVNDLAAVLADVARVLAPRGMLAFTVETHSAPALRCCRHCASPTASSICAMRSAARA